MKTTVGILAMAFLMAFGLQVNAQKVKRNSCVNGISNLTETQKTSITELEATFQKEMADYRDERQATNDLEVKKEIREKMLNARAQHQKEVSGVLNPEQQKEYAAWIDARKTRGNKADGTMGKSGKQGKKGQGNVDSKGQGKGKNGARTGKGTCLNNN